MLPDVKKQRPMHTNRICLFSHHAAALSLTQFLLALITKPTNIKPPWRRSQVVEKYLVLMYQQIGLKPQMRQQFSSNFNE